MSRHDINLIRKDELLVLLTEKRNEKPPGVLYTRLTCLNHVNQFLEIIMF
jgi:hypothetical protein